jgi:hypothetical protein
MADEVLEYASTCILPTTFIDLPLVAKREYNHDSTIYTFGLPEGKSLSLPICACVLLKAPGRGRGPNGKDDFDGSDAIRPYTPMSEILCSVSLSFVSRGTTAAASRSGCTASSWARRSGSSTSASTSKKRFRRKRVFLPEVREFITRHTAYNKHDTF